MDFLIAPPTRRAIDFQFERRRRPEEELDGLDSAWDRTRVEVNGDAESDEEDLDPKGRRRSGGGAGASPAEEDSLSEDGPAWWDFEFEEEAPGHVERRCTDPLWLFVFVLAGSFVLWIAKRFYEEEGRIAALLNFRDGSGEICEPGFLFFCLQSVGNLDLERRTCLQKCPNRSDVWIDGCHAASGYATTPYGYQLCRSAEQDFSYDHQMRHWLDVAIGRWTFSLLFEHMHELCLLLAFSIASAYFMMYTLAKNAVWIVRTGIWFLGWAPLVYGIYLSEVPRLIPVLRRIYDVLPPPPNTTLDRVEASLLVFFGLIFVGIGHLMKRSVDAAARCLALTYKCAVQSRMLHHPMTMLVAFGSLAVVLAAGLLGLGVARERSGDWRAERGLALLLLFCAYWWSQAAFAVCEFIVIYTTATWCFQGGLREEGYVSCLDVVKAHWVVARYHFGSCIYGGFIISLARPIQLTVGCLTNLLEMQGNFCAMLISDGCHSCLARVEDYVGAINKNAFNEVVLSGLPFMEAAEKTQTLLQKKVTTRGTRTILNGATLVMQVLCVTINAVVSAALFWRMLQEDEEEESLERFFLVIAGAFIGGFATLPFVLFVDSISDTILYCFEICSELERERIADDDLRESQQLPLPCMRWKRDLARGCVIS